MKQLAMIGSTLLVVVLSVRWGQQSDSAFSNMQCSVCQCNFPGL